MPATFPGYVKPANLLIDAGVLYVGSGTPVGMGATRGGLTFDPGKTMRNPDFDGKTTDIAGEDRVIEYNSKITGKMIDWSAAALSRYEAGSTSDGSTGTNTITPIPASQFLVAGDYLTDVTLIMRMQSGQVQKIHFPFAIVEKYTLATKPKDEGEADVSIKAVLGPTETNLNKAPYLIEVLT